MKVLVTGATGFVGSCLARRLIGDGHDVHLLLRGDSDCWRLEGLTGSYTPHAADLRDGPALERIVARVAAPVIFHLATYGGFTFQREQTDIIATNLLGTVNLLNACARTGFDCFVNTGSSSEYGAKSAPMAEDDLLEPVGDYAVAKAAATLYCRSLAIERNLPVTTVRLFSPYGPWDDPRRLIPHVIASLLHGRAPQLASPASVRDYVYIDDVVDLYLKLAGKPLRGEIINAGSGRQASVGDVVAFIESSVGEGPPPNWGGIGLQRSEPERWQAAVGRAGALLQWTPATGLAEGINRTVAWFRDHLGLYP
jgi:nucleoside-diphosphate-sugar epimerase